MPMSARIAWISLRADRSACRRTTTEPESTDSRPLMQRSIVDLPEPDGPAMTIASPAPIERSISSSTRLSPKLLRTSASWTSGAAPLALRHGATLRSRPACQRKRWLTPAGGARRRWPRDVARGLLDRRRPDRRRRRRRDPLGRAVVHRPSATRSTTSRARPRPGIGPRASSRRASTSSTSRGRASARDFTPPVEILILDPARDGVLPVADYSALADVLDGRPQRQRGGHGHAAPRGHLRAARGHDGGPVGGVRGRAGRQHRRADRAHDPRRVRDRRRCCWPRGSA